jgi:hypothetical protein
MMQRKKELGTEMTEDCGCEPHECCCRLSKEYIKSTKIRSLMTLIGLIEADAPLSFRALGRIHDLKKKIKEIDPGWLLVDETTVLEHQVLSLVDAIDHTIPWNSARNRLRYIDLCQTINKLRMTHPGWVIDLEDPGNRHFCKCCSCLENRKLHQQILGGTSSEKSTLYEGNREKSPN